MREHLVIAVAALAACACNCSTDLKTDAGTDAGSDAGSDASTDAGSDSNLGAKVGSGFDTSDDGWTIVGDAQARTVKPDFSGIGGNPDGLISAKDDVAGGVWYFKAPSRYLGDNSSTYGQLLSFDLTVTPITNPFDYVDVILEGDGLTVVYDTSPAPGTSWTTFSVPLSEAGWKMDALSGAAASAADFKRVLVHMTNFQIRGEFNTGPDTGSLDNVRFGLKP